MDKLIGFLIFILGGTLTYFLFEVWDMPIIGSIVALATIALTGMLVVGGD